MPARLVSRLALLVTLALIPASPAALRAQGAPRLEITLPAHTAREGPQVRGVNVLTTGRLPDLLRHGFPARLHYRIELWSTGGLLNDLESSTEWDVVVRFDPMDNSYQVARAVGNRVTLLGRWPALDAAERAIERPFTPVLRPPRENRRYYYHASLVVETLSLSDLDEVERWLRGELKPAVRGERSPGTALGRGIGRLLVRLIGGERSELDARTPTFVAKR